MRALHALALAVVAVPSLPGAASAAPAGPFTCGFASVGDVTGTTATQTGEVDGGPVVLADVAAQPVSGSLTCTIQTGWASWRHSDPDAASATSPVTPGVAYLAPSPVRYELADGDGVYLCTRVDVAGGATYYWESAEWYWPNDGERGRWTTDPDAGCDPPPATTGS